MNMTKEQVKMTKVLQKFVSTDETRYFMNDFYYDAETEKFIATDGRTMMTAHKTQICGAVTETGYYRMAGNELVKIDNGGQFPNWKRVLPDYTGSDYVKNSAVINKELVDLGRLNSLIAAKMNIWLNIDFLKRMPTGQYDFYTFNQIDAFKAVVFSPCPSIEIVIMPMMPPNKTELLEIAEKPGLSIAQ